MLATRCTACGTSFRVVQDQLRVSDGWVRCGRCNEVFNASQALFETDGQPLGPAVAPPPSALSSPLPTPLSTVPPALPPALPDLAAAQHTPLEPAIAEVAEVTEHAGVADTVELAEPPAAAASDAAAAHAATEDNAAPALAFAPTFVRRADRAAYWQRPRVRGALAATAGVLVLALAVQAAVLYRDTLAVHWPASKTALEQACAWAACSVEPLRRISALALENSGLNQFEGGTLYRLSVVLRNRGDVELMLPAFDLVLSDAQGRVTARRVLGVADLGSTARTLAAGAELSLQASLNTGERRVAGYTIEIFYP